MLILDDEFRVRDLTSTLILLVFKDEKLDAHFMQLKDLLVLNIKKALKTLEASDTTEVKTGVSILQVANLQKLLQTLMFNLQYLIDGVGNIIFKDDSDILSIV